MKLLDEKGPDALSARAVADRLAARMNAVLRHVKTRTRLLERMDGVIVGEIPLDDLPIAPGGSGLAHGERRSLLAYRDGAGLVAGACAIELHVSRFCRPVRQHPARRLRERPRGVPDALSGHPLRLRTDLASSCTVGGETPSLDG
ncbi:hypothetical protein [Streptomyces scopuliridis]|uniref:hypothetical protein n=1 Tax=Streptomyces scopuliridis TaxID=452529 RepID=UPI0036A2F4C6